jgi:hypothetical protein
MQTTEKITAMTSVKLCLARIPQEHRDEHFSHILNLIHHYIYANCKHTIVCDLFDIAEDLSKTVHYCETCYMEFADSQGTPKKISSHSK